MVAATPQAIVTATSRTSNFGIFHSGVMQDTCIDRAEGRIKPDKARQSLAKTRSAGVPRRPAQRVLLESLEHGVAEWHLPEPDQLEFNQSPG